MATLLLLIIYLAFIGLGIPDSLFGTAWPAIYTEFNLPISYGSIITITCCVTSVLLIFNMPVDISMMLPFVFMLGVAMVAAPGAPGGAVMSALPFLPMVGISSEGALASLLIALYLTQDSFGTAANISGDNASAVIVDSIYKRFIKKEPQAPATTE